MRARVEQGVVWTLFVLVLLALTTATGLALGAYFTPEPVPVVSTFKYDSGLACVQVVLGDSVAIDCTYPPGEARLGGFLADATDRIGSLDLDIAPPTTAP